MLLPRNKARKSEANEPIGKGQVDPVGSCVHPRRDICMPSEVIHFSHLIREQPSDAVMVSPGRIDRWTIPTTAEEFAANAEIFRDSGKPREMHEFFIARGVQRECCTHTVTHTDTEYAVAFFFLGKPERVTSSRVSEKYAATCWLLHFAVYTMYTV